MLKVYERKDDFCWMSIEAHHVHTLSMLATAAQNKPIDQELLNINPVPNNINEICSIGAQCNHT